MSNTSIIVIAVLVAVAALAAVVTSLARAMLHQRFGPEYERAHEELGRRANRVLVGRVRHVEGLHIRALSDGERNRFSSAWEEIQGQFVDDPQGAAACANDLIKEVMRERGYSAEAGFDQRVADLTVDHPDVVQHYRAARALALSQPPATTEDLRQAGSTTESSSTTCWRPSRAHDRSPSCANVPSDERFASWPHVAGGGAPCS